MLRVAILAHSTLPRGGVVHALELGDALTRLGHEVTVHAPDPKGAGFPRATLCATLCLPAAPVPAGGTLAMVETRVADYVGHFEAPAARRFDAFLAGDGISGNALATLKARGLIGGFARTVHHFDRFDDPRVAALQTRSIVAADRWLAVSNAGRRELRARFGIEAAIVGNGVDGLRYSPRPDGREALLRARLGLGRDPVFLAVGGVEERKNAGAILHAFARARADRPAARLVIAGGASVLDHAAYRRRFDADLAGLGLPAGAVVLAGPVPDAEMPALYRLAAALVFPSLKEGFGLAVIEAMASGVPVVTSALAPFTEYLGEGDAVWCDPRSDTSIASAMARALDPARREGLIAAGLAVAARHDWAAVARRYLPVLQSLAEPAHA